MDILIVEDDQDLAAVARVAMEKIGGHSVRMAGNGAEALTRIEEARPDLVLLDAHMPIMGGIECLERIRSHSEFSDVRVVVMTASVDRDEREQLKQAGALAVLLKPYDPLELPTTLDNLVAQAA